MYFSPDVPNIYPSLIFDAEGRELGWVVEGDTETGVVIVSIRYEDGPLIDTLRGTWVRERRRYAAPLRLEKFWTNPNRTYAKPGPDFAEPPYELLERL